MDVALATGQYPLVSDRRQDDPRPDFGARLREVRRARQLSQEALAAAAGLDRTYISSCERGKRNIGLVNIFRIASALGVAPAVLLKRFGEPIGD